MPNVCLHPFTTTQVSDEEKFRRESEAMAAIKAAAGDSDVGREIEALWNEYEKGESPEAKGVKVPLTILLSSPGCIYGQVQRPTNLSYPK